MYSQSLKFEVVGDVSPLGILDVAKDLIEGIDGDWIHFRLFTHKASVVTAGMHDVWELLEQRARKLAVEGKISIVSPKLEHRE